jgi:excisionase family DNA binding protein
MESGARLLHPIPEAVYLTGIGRSKFYELLDSGAIESVKVGSRRLVPHEALERFTESLRSTPAA